MSLTWDLVDAGRLDEARLLAPFYGRINPGSAKIALWFVSNSSAAPEREAWKGTMLQAAALLEPDDAEVKAALEAWRKH
jgi:hypothetical protein